MSPITFGEESSPTIERVVVRIGKKMRAEGDVKAIARAGMENSMTSE